MIINNNWILNKIIINLNLNDNKWLIISFYFKFNNNKWHNQMNDN